MSDVRVLSIMAHQDDFEFTAAGFFALLRRNLGERAKLKIMTTNRGASGHHEMGLEETAARRDKEARASAALVGAEYENLKGLDGKPIPMQVYVDANTLGGLWNAIRVFDPHYIICPPVTTDPRAGIHIDHYNTAWAVRMLAYQLTVPHAYPLLSEAAAGRRESPLIITVDDGYAKEIDYDVALDISSVYETKERMALCHESQVFEWLPWNKGLPTMTRETYLESFKERHRLINRRYGFADVDTPREFFIFTRWGRAVKPEDVELLFPGATTGIQA